MTEKDERTMNRRLFLKRSGAAAALWSVSARSRVLQAAGGRSPRRPNIVFVFADQMRSHALGCYGNKQVATPNFDRIAEEGALFRNAISCYPVCSPYRAMLLTGLYPMRNGVVGNDTAPLEGTPRFAALCKDAGYATAYIGKWHLEWNRNPFVPKRSRSEFDFWASRNCSHQHFDSFYCGETPEHTALPGYEPEAQARLAAEFIQKNRERPFCLFLSWGPPHDPYRAPEQYMNAFPPESLKFRENVRERRMVDYLLETDPSPLPERTRKARASRRAMIDDDAKLRQRCLQGYYAATRALDDAMGVLLEALDAAGLGDDTILAFSSDHGDMMGSHRMLSKQMPFEESISVPFLLRYPRKIEKRTVTDALMGPIDVLPTLLSLAGVATPKSLDGKDLSAAAMGGASDQREALPIMKMVSGGNPWVCNGVTPWRGVRTKRYTYARLLDRGPWVLFDNKKDPRQMNNLIGRPEYADLQARLDAETTRLMKEAGDPGDTAAIEKTRATRKGGARV